MTVDETGINTDTLVMTAIEQLLTLAAAYGAAESVEPKTVSWRVFGDSKKLDAIQTGSDIQVGRYEKALQWFSDNWPERAAWPEAVKRPTPAREAAA